MISKIISVSFFFGFCLALDDPKLAKLLDYQLENTGRGHYFYRFASSDGISREEEGNLLDETVADSPVIVKGSYSYTDETGQIFTVRYIADENGFHPEGDHINVPVNIPLANDGKIFIPSTARPLPVIRFTSTTPRPEFLRNSPRIQFSTTARPENTRIQVPVTSRIQTTPRTIAFNELDEKLQHSIVSFLSNGDGRGLNIAAVNSL